RKIKTWQCKTQTWQRKGTGKAKKSCVVKEPCCKKDLRHKKVCEVKALVIDDVK
ncbi:6315_t:CDS:1, partial [Gigaspora margarita]